MGRIYAAVRLLLRHGVGAFVQRARERLRYAMWRRHHEPSPRELQAMCETAARFRYTPRISLLMPAYNSNPALLEAAVASVLHQVYPHWQLCIADDGSPQPHVRSLIQQLATDPRIRVTFRVKNGGIAAATNSALALADGDYVGFFDHDDVLPPWSLYEYAKALNLRPDLDFIYSDQDMLNTRGERCFPAFKPQWSPDLLTSFCYVGMLVVIRRTLVQEVGGSRSEYDGAQDGDLYLRCLEKLDPRRVGHIPRVCYHWRMSPTSAAANVNAKPYAWEAAVRMLQETLRRRGESGTVSKLLPGTYRVQRAVTGTPRVSVIVLDLGDTRALERCLASVAALSWANRETLTVGRGHALSTATAVRVADDAGPAIRGNAGAREATGTHLLFIDSRCHIESTNLIEEMLGHSQRTSVGVVGAKLTGPDGRIRHGGYVIGGNGHVHALYNGLPANNSGYFYGATVIRNCTAVSGQCLMVRRETFAAAGGFNSDFDQGFHDVDFCLSVGRSGLGVVWTPFAVARVDGAAPVPSDAVARRLRQKWSLTGRDRYYNPNLVLAGADYVLRP